MIKCHNTLESLTDTQKLIIARAMFGFRDSLPQLSSSFFYHPLFAVLRCQVVSIRNACTFAKCSRKIYFFMRINPGIEERSELTYRGGKKPHIIYLAANGNNKGGGMSKCEWMSKWEIRRQRRQPSPVLAYIEGVSNRLIRSKFAKVCLILRVFLLF